ncbi:hypothetical protein BGZ76_003316 [Entomortierella beljakovae]|nr:hypothetical protein BGZ76_003316 [Entomortierella beljakovae]
MHSIIKVALAALVTLTVLTPSVRSQAQEDLIDSIRADGGPIAFNDPRNPLSSLAEGSYGSAALGFMPMVASTVQLSKRQRYCDPGYGLCSNKYCCPLDELCAPGGGCCPRGKPYVCGGKYCCTYGCDSIGNCQCPSTYPVACGG